MLITRFTQRMIPYIIIAILLLIIFVLRECNNKPDTKYLIATARYTIVKPIPYNKYYPAPYPVQVIDSFERPSKIDTDAILKDYYKAIIYDRPIMDDSNGKLSLRDTVTHNRLRGFKLTGHLNRFTDSITNTIENPLKYRIFIGAYMPINNMTLGFAPMVTLLTKNDKSMYSIGYDPFNSMYYIGVQFKITLKK
jgi:hypothetical protein